MILRSCSGLDGWFFGGGERTEEDVSCAGPRRARSILFRISLSWKSGSNSQNCPIAPLNCHVGLPGGLERLIRPPNRVPQEGEKTNRRGVSCRPRSLLE